MCDQWHLSLQGDSCANIASRYQVSIDELVQWNPSIGPQCSSFTVGHEYVSSSSTDLLRIKELTIDIGTASRVQSDRAHQEDMKTMLQPPSLHLRSQLQLQLQHQSLLQRQG